MKDPMNNTYRAGLCLAIITGLLLIWMNLAVGLIGNEDNPANLMYLGVLGVGFIGALIARFKPFGMARSLVATAGAQALVFVIAYALDLNTPLIINVFFVVLWVGSALLFKKASAIEQIKPK